MRNFTWEHLHVIENAGCRCKICKGSIFKSQKRQDADVIVHDRQAKSICKFEEKQVADTLVKKRASVTENIKVLQIQRLLQRYLQH